MMLHHGQRILYYRNYCRMRDVQRSGAYFVLLYHVGTLGISLERRKSLQGLGKYTLTHT